MIKSNAKKVAKQLEKETKKLVVDLQDLMQKWGNKTVNKARRNHRYKDDSYNLDKAQKADMDGLNLKIWIDPQLVTSKGYNYGLIQHDGAPKNGFDGEPWLEEVVDKNSGQLEKEILQLVDKVLG